MLDLIQTLRGVACTLGMHLFVAISSSRKRTPLSSARWFRDRPCEWLILDAICFSRKERLPNGEFNSSLFCECRVNVLCTSRELSAIFRLPQYLSPKRRKMSIKSAGTNGLSVRRRPPSKAHSH